MEELCLRAQEMRGGEAWSGGTLEGQRQERLKPPVAAGDVLSCPVAAGQRIISAPVEAGGGPAEKPALVVARGVAAGPQDESARSDCRGAETTELSVMRGECLKFLGRTAQLPR